MGDFITQNIFPIVALVISGASMITVYKSDAAVTKEKVTALRLNHNDLAHEVTMCKVQHIEHTNFQKEVIAHMATVKTENVVMKEAVDDLKTATGELVKAVNILNVAVTKIH